MDDIYLPINDLRDVVAVDYHFEKGLIFFVDGNAKQIRWMALEGRNLSQLSDKNITFSVQTIVSSELSKPSSVAVDWIANNLYWADQERHLIEVARLDGSSRKILIDLDLDKPKCLAILPDSGVIFWIDVGEHQKIERGN